jgi:hypothetical protein
MYAIVGLVGINVSQADAAERSSRFSPSIVDAMAGIGNPVTSKPVATQALQFSGTIIATPVPLFALLDDEERAIPLCDRGLRRKIDPSLFRFLFRLPGCARW